MGFMRKRMGNEPDPRANGQFFANNSSLNRDRNEEPSFIQSRPVLQEKLKIGPSNDKYEQEADRVADRVVDNTSNREALGGNGSTDSGIQRSEEAEQEVQAKSIGDISPLVQKMESDDDPVQKMDEEQVQQKGKSDGARSGKGIEGRLNASRGRGSAMDDQTRAQMESSFGKDFSGVNIHTDSNAVQMSEDIGAKAFTNGNDIYFNQNKYNPDTKEGKHLLAHELTHTVQQGAVSGNVQKSDIIQRDIKGKGKVALGEFEIDMVKKEIPAHSTAGVDGTIKFKPNTKSPNTKEIGLVQIVKDTDLRTTPQDYKWTGGEADRNKMMTSEKTKEYTTKENDTLNTIAKKHITAMDIYRLNKATLGAFDPDKKITTSTKLKIPAVQKGYFVDHLAADSYATPRTNKADKEVPAYYNMPKANTTEWHDGHKKSKTDIRDASLSDYPGGSSTDQDRYDFETVARSHDKGFDYGTIHWGLTFKLGKVSGEYFKVVPGTSDTFKSAVMEFNKFYKNHHKVVKGDTLYKLAKLYYGDGNKWKEIQKANKLRNTVIVAGQELIIPKITKQ